MAKYLVTDTELKSVADAIRTKGGTEEALVFPNGFVSAIETVPGAGNIQPLSVTENGIYTPPSGVDGYAPVTVNVSGGGEKLEATAAVQNDVVVVDGCTIVSQPAIVDGKMEATGSLGLEISPVPLMQNVCLEVDYKYVNGDHPIVFSFGGSNNTDGGVLLLSNTYFEYYAWGTQIRRIDLNINFDQERHVKIIATMANELYLFVDDALVLNASHNNVHCICAYCLSSNNIALGWNQSSHEEYNPGTFNNLKISFDVDLPNT